MTTETPIRFKCGGDTLVGILHQPSAPAERGVVVVVGGPQYRIGSHRQFVLLARALADGGMPVLRFDYRGMGDSDGAYKGFDEIGQDIAAAVEAFRHHVPTVQSVVLWGLCDAATAITFYAHRDSRVAAIAIANPWVRTQAGIARAYLRHYYLARLISADFWRKLATGRFDAVASVKSMLGFVGQASTRREAPTDTDSAPPTAGCALPERMAEGLARFQGEVLLIMSGNDLTAREFDENVADSRRWRKLLRGPLVTRRDLPAADHTFSRRDWRDEVARLTLEWLRSW